VEPVHVEHSVPGAYGFIVHTSKGAIVYSGDLRMHGPQRALTEDFIERAKAAKPIALLIEGTRMGSETEHNITEEEVEGKIDGIVKASKGLVFAYFSMSNVDRFMSVYASAVRNKRIMVIDTRFAYIIDSLREYVPTLPDVMEDKNIRVYFRLAKSCTYADKDYFVYERKYLPKMIKAEDIAKDQKRYLMHMGFNKLIELVYIQPKDADYIYSSSEHFLEGEENEEERKVLENWMEHFKVRFHKAHCSGHASKKDIAHIIKEIDPKILIPIHTDDPGAFKAIHKDVRLPEKDGTLRL